MRVLIVGQGRVGSGLANALRPSLIEAQLCSSRRPVGVGAAEVVVLAVSDPAIAEVAKAIASSLDGGAVLLHTSGNHGPGLLSGTSMGGERLGAMHPLVSFCDPHSPPKLEGTTFLIDGGSLAVEAAEKIADALGARRLRARLHGPAYHGCAALAANGAAALAMVAADGLISQGVAPDAAHQAIGALLCSVGENLQQLGARALSGPVMRGDEQAVVAHRRALGEANESTLRAYDALGPIILGRAVDAGLSEEAAVELAKLFAESS